MSKYEMAALRGPLGSLLLGVTAALTLSIAAPVAQAAWPGFSCMDEQSGCRATEELVRGRGEKVLLAKGDKGEYEFDLPSPSAWFFVSSVIYIVEVDFSSVEGASALNLKVELLDEAGGIVRAHTKTKRSSPDGASALEIKSSVMASGVSRIRVTHENRGDYPVTVNRVRVSRDLFSAAVTADDIWELPEQP